MIALIAAMARELHLDTVAEGIETAGQLDRMKKLNCQFGQGYLFSPPIDVEGANGLLERVLLGSFALNKT